VPDLDLDTMSIACAVALYIVLIWWLLPARRPDPRTPWCERGKYWRKRG